MSLEYLGSIYAVSVTRVTFWNQKFGGSPYFPPKGGLTPFFIHSAPFLRKEFLPIFSKKECPQNLQKRVLTKYYSTYKNTNWIYQPPNTGNSYQYWSDSQYRYRNGMQHCTVLQKQRMTGTEWLMAINGNQRQSTTINGDVALWHCYGVNGNGNGRGNQWRGQAATCNNYGRRVKLSRQGNLAPLLSTAKGLWMNSDNLAIRAILWLTQTHPFICALCLRHWFTKVKNLITALPLVAHTCASLQIELRASLITFRMFVRWQRLTARNVAELFSYNCGVSHSYAACCIDELSRGSIRGMKFSQTTSDRKYRTIVAR